MDLRITRTRNSIFSAFLELRSKKALERITVKELTEKAGISKQTFYLHFKDIYDLVEWSCIEDATRALEGKKTYDTWQEGFYNIFEAVLENKVFILNAYHSISREHVESYLYKLTYDLLIGVVNEKSEGMQVR